MVDPKTRKVKFDQSDPQLSARAHERADRKRFEASAAGAPPPATLVDPARAEIMAELRASRAEASAQGTKPDPSERLAQLQSLVDKGLINDEQFERQRQRIIDSI